jgi:hypothetical protein
MMMSYSKQVCNLRGSPDIARVVKPSSRSQWPRRVKHELSSPAQILGSWFRISLEAWMFVCVYSVLVLFCVGGDLAAGWTACCVISRSLTTASKIGDSSVSRAQAPSSQPPVQKSTFS